MKQGSDLHGTHNCAQCVLMALNDKVGMTQEEAVRCGAPFGTGISGLREVCGCVTALAMLAAKTEPVTDATDAEAKKRQRTLVQQMAEEFRAENGDLVCARLKNPAIMGPNMKSCKELIASAIQIAGKRL